MKLDDFADDPQPEPRALLGDGLVVLQPDEALEDPIAVRDGYCGAAGSYGFKEVGEAAGRIEDAVWLAAGPDGGTLEGLLRIADRRLYAAKRSGPGHVVGAGCQEISIGNGAPSSPPCLRTSRSELPSRSG